jgi:hypothetical protein
MNTDQNGGVWLYVIWDLNLNVNEGAISKTIN